MYSRILRATWTRQDTLLSRQIPLTYLGQWQSKRGIITPFQWARDRIMPKYRQGVPKAAEAAAQKEDAEKGQGSIFDDLPKVIEQKKSDGPKKVHTEHKYSTANFKISRRKLNLLSRQIAGKPIDHAILQMEFSHKRASKRIKSTLVLARQHAVEYKGLDRSKLIVAESWVTKGPKLHKRVDIKGRGRVGMKEHPDSRLSVILREGKTYEQKAQELRKKKLRKIRSAGIMPDNRPLVNVPPIYAW